jgi:hypothetical protein
MNVHPASAVVALFACMLLACCAPPPGPAAQLTMADISPILTPLAYREVLGAKCNEPNMAVKTAFMADLKAAGATDALLAKATAEADRISTAERDTLPEYVCTAELYESTEESAAAAQKAWAELKARKP